MKLLLEDYEVIRRWIYHNARPLDLARWKFHFENGGISPVLESLTAYQNEDGGFGHALEADAWNPNSTPIQTATAVERLLELEFEDAEHSIVQGILKYLDSGVDMEDRTWNNVVASNNDYPHAPWWHTSSDSTARSFYNPTAILAGFILKFTARDSALFERGVDIARGLAEFFLRDPELEMHPLKCVATLLKCIAWADLQEQFPYSSLQEAVQVQSARLIARDAAEWSGYSCRPSAFIKSPQSPGYADQAGLMQQELDYLLETRNPEGIWNLTWSWAGYEREYAISENWWKAHIAIENLLLLQVFGRLAT
ncbi:hypothetical protein [Paenibacillus donghaensis]|uniref:Squalene cyclase C-terminal domain-containing protein n=1 Tax=Paenibacillus donghaensis TaxID=414771 RepID=A0A2Z2KHI4_9BACL|nr:hypothetical protein [Paenibacillus donghaensis]ASA21639.1 hypothetical protein B9T62_13175 [Paenibacillus donghaensis]